MNINTDMIKTVFSKTAFKLRKHAPEILMGAGIIGVGGSMVMMCKATLKAPEIIEEHENTAHSIHIVAMAAGLSEIPDDISDKDKQFVEECKKTSSVEYTEKDYRSDTVSLYSKTAIQFIKLYGPSVALAGLSMGCILTSHSILKKRNIAIAAAYATVDKGFKEYRNRVIERFGKDVDTEIRHNIKAEKFKEPVTDENGNTKTVKTTVPIADPEAYSTYARCFDENSSLWTKDSERNLLVIRQQERYANDILKSRGYLFLNEVYDMLDIPRSRAGQAVGWVYDENNDVGDNYVDFGIYSINRESNRRFVNGYERAIWLDFNVDGPILDNFRP